MSSANQLISWLAEIDTQMVACMRCGFCQAVCPLYAQTGREVDVARGKVALLRGLADSLLTEAGEVKAHLDRCLLCGSCASGCPSGVKVMEIFIKGRAILGAYLGMSPAKKLIFRGLLAHPGLFNGIMSLAPGLQDLFAKPVDPGLDTSCPRLPGILSGRHIKRLASVPFHKIAARRRVPHRPQAAFFIGCLVDKLYPSVGEASLRVLEHHGISAAIPPGQACCGLPALAAGDAKAFAALAVHNLSLLAGHGYEAIVTACATCASALRHIWPMMAGELPSELRSRAQKVADKTFEVTQFAAQAGVRHIEGAASGRGKVTYHDPCHLKKSLGVALEPRQVLAASKGLELVEMNEADHCCGLGGSFGLEHYAESSSIGRRKLDNILATGARTLATTCPACMLQISGAISQQGAAVRVKHVIEVYAQALEHSAGGNLASQACSGSLFHLNSPGTDLDNFRR